ncbi:AbrB family transcriptional regulator [Donghicola mangrovi]|uniref:AbrB family transcriptional regulator n=1 Tax=Donghicola mangrovi TaxID=2729614 RepID=A0A850Q3S1_9RHOB|nr:AbrB family transcriptional regulator [Donghicola mangrovi]NVO24317.1 AbrB family transcriptional regulator [Donghicola mangrovi]
MKQQAVTVAIAAIGASVFLTFGLPLPFLFGPMFACLGAALAGVTLRGFGQISVGARTILGVAVGASITPALFGQIPGMMASVALIPLFIALIGLVGVPFFYRVWKFDLPTAYYAAMPGGLQDMVIFGTEAGGDPRALSLVHATRVLIIVTVAPVLLTHFYGASLHNPVGLPASDVPWQELVLMVLAAIIGWKGAERIGLFGASILGPMIVTAALSLSGFIHVRPPREAILCAQFLIGTGIGVQFVGVTFAELRKFVAAGVAYVGLLAVLSEIFAQIVSRNGWGQPVEALLAFAPGGQAEMTVLAIVSGADLGFVVTHHLLRIILVITGAPLIGTALRKWSKG